MSNLRSKVLSIAGASAVVAVWARRLGRPHGITVRRAAGVLEFRQGDYVVRVAAKHAFFAAEVVRHFAVFSKALPPSAATQLRIADYTQHLETFNMVRFCLHAGVTLHHRGEEVWLRKDNRAMVLAPKHFVYALELARKFELYFAPLVPELREDAMVLDYSRPGTLQTYKSGLQFEMASFPEEEEAIEEYFRWYRPVPGDLVFDMGAHCGVSTYHLAKLVGPQGRVIAFEPDPVNCAILRRNVERHQLTNVAVENSAIAGVAGQLQFNSEGTIGSGLASLLDRDSVGSIVTVSAMTLPDAFARWGVPAFCKIDIEGAEVDVLAQSASTLRAHPTHFALDTNHPKPDGQMTYGDVEGLFRSCGYEVLSEAKPLWTTWARPA